MLVAGTWGLGLGCGCKTILFHMDKVSFEIGVQLAFKVVRKSKDFKILISGVFIVHVDFCSSFVKFSMWSMLCKVNIDYQSMQLCDIE
jgi:hypothetical protein